MSYLLLLCVVTLWGNTPTGDGLTFTTKPASQRCEIAESEEAAALKVFHEHFYSYPNLHGVRLYKIDLSDMTFTQVRLKIVKLEEAP